MYQELGKLILENVGGKENISNVTHCATRLRFNLKECKKVDVDKIKGAKGVIGIADSNGQFQVIIGSEVSKVYKEIIKIIGTIETEGNSSEKKRGLVGFFEVISGIFTP
ncbi:MAG: PTS transporter subunit EIIB, partial [Cetobacterium sp.]